MKHAIRHEPIITDHSGACSCRRWNGLFRHADEKQGEFTVRAVEEHRKHADAARQPVQADMFEAGDLFSERFEAEMFQ